MNSRSVKAVWLVAMSVLSIALTGCVGWGDIFAKKRSIAPDFYLMQGEGSNLPDTYLFMGKSSNSFAGPLHKIGWNQQYVIFTDENWPNPWNVIRIEDQKKFTITEKQRTTEDAYKLIPICTPRDAWKYAKH